MAERKPVCENLNETGPGEIPGLFFSEMKTILFFFLISICLAGQAGAHPSLNDLLAADPTEPATMRKMLALQPEADLSLVWQTQGREAIEEIAQYDAQFYFEDHKPTSAEVKGSIDIGRAHALKHQLAGEALNVYEVEFFATMRALDAARK